MGMTRWSFISGEKERNSGIFFVIIGLSISSVFLPSWFFGDDLGFGLSMFATVVGWILIFHGVKIIRDNKVMNDNITIPLIAIFLFLAFLWQAYIAYAYFTDNNPYKQKIELSGLTFCSPDNATATKIPNVPNGYIGKIEQCITACKMTFSDSKKWFYDYNSVIQPKCICYRCD